MLDFHKPTINDKGWVDECLSHVGSMNCEYTFGNLFSWADNYNTTICKYNDFLITKWGIGNDINYSIPLGVGDFTSAVNEIISHALNNGYAPKIYGITSAYLSMLQEAFTGKFSYEQNDDFSDYIYSVEKMANLKGKKYHGKRNHISNFKKNNPSWCFEMLSQDNMQDCLDYHKMWINDKDMNNEEYLEEYNSVKKAFDNFDALGLVGGLIRVEGKVIAYTFGEPQMNGKCFVTHYEKADASVQGAYPIINQEFTKNCLLQYEYVNREEDLGIEGLRKSKQSYYPELLLEKCLAVYND